MPPSAEAPGAESLRKKKFGAQAFRFGGRFGWRRSQAEAEPGEGQGEESSLLSSLGLASSSRAAREPLGERAAQEERGRAPPGLLGSADSQNRLGAIASENCLVRRERERERKRQRQRQRQRPKAEPLPEVLLYYSVVVEHY